MNLKRLVPILLVGVALVTGLSAFTVVQTVSADTSTPPAASDTSAPGRGGRGGSYTSDELAAALNITADELTQATTDAKSAALAQAVKDGLITQAQADEMNAEAATGLRGSKGLKGLDIDFDTYLANALGISTDELSAARSAALDAHLAAQVADGSLTQEQADLIKGRQTLFSSDAYTSSMKAAFESAVAQAVNDGTITQAQADAILAENADNASFTGMGRMGGGHRH